MKFLICYEVWNMEMKEDDTEEGKLLYLRGAGRLDQNYCAKRVFTHESFEMEGTSI